MTGDDRDRLLEAAMTDLLAERAATATICPSEAARRVDPAGWRNLMEAARRLVDAGVVEMVQQGRVVEPATARGPIRIRLVR